MVRRVSAGQGGLTERHEVGGQQTKAMRVDSIHCSQRLPARTILQRTTEEACRDDFDVRLERTLV
jgi:hypothetical protein